jgi:hypothetical protein
LNAVLHNEGKAFINIVEDEGIPSFPNVPENSSVDSGFFEASEEELQHVSQRGIAEMSSVGVEEAPNILRPRAPNQQVISVFVRKAGGASSRGGHSVTEAALVGGEASSSSEPAEDLAFQRRSSSPDHVCLIIHLQMPERIGVEIFVC